MADKDISTKRLEEYNVVFADIVNVLLFKGKRIINPDSLRDAVATSQYKFMDQLHEQERDVAKFCMDGNIRICFLGLENQTEIDKDMPLRVISYDGAMYRAQLLDKKNKTRYPVITLVLYFGESRWTDHKKLTECLQIPEPFKPYVNEYEIRVFEIAHLPRETVDLFTSDFWIIADYFWQKKHNKFYVPSNKAIEYVDAFMKMMQALTKDSRYGICTDGVKKVVEEGGKVTMCYALEQSCAIGKAEGVAIGKAEERIALIKRIMKKHHMSQNEAMDFLDIPVTERGQIVISL